MISNIISHSLPVCIILHMLNYSAVVIPLAYPPRGPQTPVMCFTNFLEFCANCDLHSFPSHLWYMITLETGTFRTRDSICNDVCAERCLKITSCFIVLGLIYCFCIAFRTIQPNYFNSRFKSCECNPTPTLRLVSLEERTTTSFSLMCLLNFCNSPQL